MVQNPVMRYNLVVFDSLQRDNFKNPIFILYNCCRIKRRGMNQDFANMILHNCELCDFANIGVIKFLPRIKITYRINDMRFIAGLSF